MTPRDWLAGPTDGGAAVREGTDSPIALQREKRWLHWSPDKISAAKGGVALRHWGKARVLYDPS